MFCQALKSERLLGAWQLGQRRVVSFNDGPTWKDRLEKVCVVWCGRRRIRARLAGLGVVVCRHATLVCSS